MKKVFTLNFTESQLATINQSLMLAPYGVAAPVIAHINSEIQRLYNEQYDRQREQNDAPLSNPTV